MKIRTLIALTAVSSSLLSVSASAGTFSDIFGGAVDMVSGVASGAGRMIKGVAMAPVNAVKFAYNHPKTTAVTVTAAFCTAWYLHNNPEVVTQCTASASDLMTQATTFATTQYETAKAFVTPYYTQAMTNYLSPAYTHVTGVLQALPGQIGGMFDSLNAQVASGSGAASAFGRQALTKMVNFKNGTVDLAGTVATTISNTTSAVVRNNIFQSASAGVTANLAADQIKTRFIHAKTH